MIAAHGNPSSAPQNRLLAITNPRRIAPLAPPNRPATPKGKLNVTVTKSAKSCIGVAPPLSMTHKPGGELWNPHHIAPWCSTAIVMANASQRVRNGVGAGGGSWVWGTRVCCEPEGPGIQPHSAHGASSDSRPCEHLGHGFATMVGALGSVKYAGQKFPAGSAVPSSVS